MAPDRRSRFENQTFRVFSTARNEALNRFRRPPSERKSICLIAAFHALWAQTRTEDRTKRTEGAARLRAAQHRNYLADGHCTSIDAAEWNWLDVEYEYNPMAKLVHYTLGTPCFHEFADQGDFCDDWHKERIFTEYCQQRVIV